MCEICKNTLSRTYSHSRTREHKKKLFAHMNKKKELAIITYGYFKYN